MKTVNCHHDTCRAYHKISNPRQGRLWFWPCWFVCLFDCMLAGFLVVLVYLSVCLTASRITYKIMNRFAWNFYHRCICGQWTTHSVLGMIKITVRMKDSDFYPDAGGGLQSLTNCLVVVLYSRYQYRYRFIKSLLHLANILSFVWNYFVCREVPLHGASL